MTRKAGEKLLGVGRLVVLVSLQQRERPIVQDGAVPVDEAQVVAALTVIPGGNRDGPPHIQRATGGRGRG